MCVDSTCCSKHGWCGTTPAHCLDSTPRSSVLPVFAPSPASDATCGGGQVGNGVCTDGMCCSQSGWCGTSREHCSKSAMASPESCSPKAEYSNAAAIGMCSGVNVGDGVCTNGMCCSQHGWCRTSADHCTAGPLPRAATPITTAPTSITTQTCGRGNAGNGICADGTCCLPHGWCSTSAQHCGSANPFHMQKPSPPTGGLGLLTLADLQTALDMFNSLQEASVQATQNLVDLVNNSTQNYSLYRHIAFVAHTIWESGGYVYTEELDASAHENYQTCDWNTNERATNGKLFYGHGYMQLSWCANYKAYGQSRMINGDPDYFYNNPELVATDYRMDSAAWFFEEFVTDDSGHFGLTTNAINGAIECQASENTCQIKPKKHYQNF